jgi:hypothetical protein
MACGVFFLETPVFGWIICLFLDFLFSLSEMNKKLNVMKNIVIEFQQQSITLITNCN